ncbi:MAG: hypothetical protein KGJ13_02740 [Patescibacteria group bacterium]|nr:hypothetical protein [Patescibacteria group bacterium]
MERLMRKLKKYLIPHPENDHRPHLLRRHTVFFVCGLMVVAEIIFLAGPSYLIIRSKLFGVIVVNALIDETNENRLASKLPPLQVSPLLQAAAQDKANDMATKGYFAHTSPQGLTPWYWFGVVGYNFSSAGENLAVNFSDSQDVTNAWMNSPEHRANILNGDFTQIGMATAQGTYDGRPAIFVVELFGAPAGPAIISHQPPTTGKSAVVIAKSKTKPAAPIRLAVATSGALTSTPSFVAVKGAETQNAGTPAGNNRQSAVSNQNNPVQNAVAAPHAIANDIYLFIIGLFVIALVLNIFIKIRIQYPGLIMGGVIVVALAAVFIVLNNQAVSHILVL